MPLSLAHRAARRYFTGLCTGPQVCDGRPAMHASYARVVAFRDGVGAKQATVHQPKERTVMTKMLVRLVLVLAGALVLATSVAGAAPVGALTEFAVGAGHVPFRIASG